MAPLCNLKAMGFGGEKSPMTALKSTQSPVPRSRFRPSSKASFRIIFAAVITGVITAYLGLPSPSWHWTSQIQPNSFSQWSILGRFAISPNSIDWSGNLKSPYGKFPRHDDPFHFMPCTSSGTLPALEDPEPTRSWAARFDPNPDHWSWGNKTTARESSKDRYAGRGIYLCGYVDAPLDYTNKTDKRIVRLAVTKFQVAGLSKSDFSADGTRSKRTLIIEPGGPGGSGTSFVWRRGEWVTDRFSDGEYDVLGWDPRGVNSSLPAMSCFPYDADRDRWSLTTMKFYSTIKDHRKHLEVADAYNDAVFGACKTIHGDLPRFMTTAFVARDLDLLRDTLKEPDVSGYFVSYGTGIGQTYANMFPNRVGRLILDGTEYVRDHRLLGGFGWTALDNGTDAWNDGFIGECVAAGPKHCDLARSDEGGQVTTGSLKSRLSRLLGSLIERPLPAYTNTSGPSLITYSSLVPMLYSAMYGPSSWPRLASALSQMEHGNTTSIAEMLDRSAWEFQPPTYRPTERAHPASDELTLIVICSDSYDAPQPPFDSHDKDGLDWWQGLWYNMTQQNWIAGDDRFYSVFPCRRYNQHFSAPAEVYRGDLNNKLSNPVLLIAETYDPATPLRNGRRLLKEMGDNARLIVHHGYGHSSQDKSNCTDAIAKAYIMDGTLPKESETDCYANEKPYRYSEKVTANLFVL